VKFDAEQALRLIAAHRVQWVNFVPTMMHRIWALPEDVRNAYDLSSLKIVFHMAAPMPPWLRRNGSNGSGRSGSGSSMAARSGRAPA